jgi:Na+-driven multidrug efflux pump
LPLDKGHYVSATIISQYISAILVLRALTKDTGILHLDLRCLCLDRKAAKRILQVGLPAGVQSTVFALSNVVIQSSINSFNSTAVVAGSATATSIEGFINTGCNAIHQTALTFSSQNYGAGKCKRVDKTIILCIIYATLIGLFLGNLAVFWGYHLASIYTPGEEEVIAETLLHLRIICSTQFICGVMDTLVGVLRGIGYSFVPMVVSLLGACGIRLLWIFTIFQIYHTPTTLYLSYPISWVITGGAHFIFLLLIRKRAYLKTCGHRIKSSDRIGRE